MPDSFPFANYSTMPEGELLPQPITASLAQESPAALNIPCAA